MPNAPFAPRLRPEALPQAAALIANMIEAYLNACDLYPSPETCDAPRFNPPIEERSSQDHDATPAEEGLCLYSAVDTEPSPTPSGEHPASVCPAREKRALYDADLAQRRYEQVDPANRLVATSLELRWNEALQRVDDVRRELAEFQSRQTLTFTVEQRERIQALIENVPRLWRAQTTSDKDRKRMLRLLIEDITVERRHESLTAILHVRWSGGVCQDLEVQLPAKVADRLRYSTETVELVRRLAADSDDVEIAAWLNEAGKRSAQGKAFTTSMISWIRYKHRIPAPVKRRPGELTVQQVAKQFGVSHHVVYYWIDRRMLSTRQVGPNHPYWITFSSEQELELTRRVRESSRIK